jgi:hypothetical protein
LDLDLPWYLNSIIATSEAQGNDLAIFLMADHGMRYGDYTKSIPATQEHRLPAFFLITNSAYLDQKFPFALDVLEHNTQRLTTMYDIRRTILDMAGDLDLEGEYGYNLLTEKISSTRTCEDA